MKLTDGTGFGYDAKVDSYNRLHTRSVSTTQSATSSASGDAFNINTGKITLTSANPSAVLYVKNTGDKPIIIETIFYLLGTSAGGAGDILLSFWRNPTQGTIITSQSIAEMAGINRNFGSAKVFEADVYKGFEGATLTDGEKAIETLLTQTSQRVAITAGDIILPKSASLGIIADPAPGTTSLALEVALSCYVNGVS